MTYQFFLLGPLAGKQTEFKHHHNFLADPKLPQDLKQKDESDLMILDLLPMERSVARIVTEYLVRMQNDFITLANPRADRYRSPLHSNNSLVTHTVVI